MESSSSCSSSGIVLYIDIYIVDDYSLVMLCHNSVIDLLERCTSMGLVFTQVIAPCLPRGYRVVFNNVSAVLRLENIIKWFFMPRSRRVCPLLVTAWYGCALTFAFSSIGGFAWHGCSSASMSNWIAMTGCCKELGSQGLFYEILGGHC